MPEVFAQMGGAFRDPGVPEPLLRPLPPGTPSGATSSWAPWWDTLSQQAIGAGKGAADYPLSTIYELLPPDFAYRPGVAAPFGKAFRVLSPHGEDQTKSYWNAWDFMFREDEARKAQDLVEKIKILASRRQQQAGVR